VEECKPLGGGGQRGDAARADRVRSGPQRRGRAVQVDPIKPTLKAPGTKRLNLTYSKLLSSLAFKFKLRRYAADRNGSTALHLAVALGKVGRCNFKPIETREVRARAGKVTPSFTS
jgi:hypothetical protein